MPSTLSAITAADVKAYFNYSDSNRDAQIAAILPIVVDIIKEYCGHDFESKTRTAEKPYIENSYTTAFFLKYRPVASITSITEGTDTLVENTDFWVDNDSGKVTKCDADDDGPVFAIKNYWSDTPKDISVTYVGGSALTQDVVMAFYEIAGIYTQINQKVYVNIEGNEVATKYDKIPAEIKEILNRHCYYKYITV